VSARRVVAAAVLALALAGVRADLAAATEVSATELRELAQRAADDPAALGRLRGVDAVDGAAVDVGAALGDATGEELRERLEALAAVPGTGESGTNLSGPRAGEPATTAADARADAREILAERRFRGTRVQGPFRGLLDRIGRWLAPLGDLVPRLDRTLPGGRAVVWTLLAAAVLGLGWLLAGRTIRRRAALAAAAGHGGPGRRESPGELERRAEEAERRGEHEAALRLRFRAGLLRLDARGSIDYRPSLQTHEVSSALHSDAFDRLAAGFDEVVYGERPASSDDVDAARRDWEAVLR
jgi:hypothetical protein